MKLELLVVAVFTLVVGCSKKEAATQDDGNSGAAKKQLRRSFDSNLNSPPKRISALETAKENAAKSGTNTLNPEIKGREASVADGILGMDGSDARNLAMIQLISQWIETDIDAAMAFGDSIENDLAMKRAFYQGASPYLSEHRPGELLDIISDGNWWPDQWLPERAALQRIATEDFDRALDFLANTDPTKQHGEEAYRFTKQIAETQSTEAAFAYAERLQAPKGKPGAIRAAVAQLTDEDSLAASEYARDITDPLLRDHAILGLVDGLWQTNPEDTITWVGSIEDGEIRSDTYSRLAASWQLTGATDTVESLLESPDLSPGERAAIEAALQSEDPW